MQDQKTAGQAEDWELSEAYYKEDTGKKELRLEDFLEEETAEGQSGLADGSSLTEQLEAMAAQVKQIRASGRSDRLHAGDGRAAGA